MSDKRELIIVALGGNALLNSKSKGTIEEREEAAALHRSNYYLYFRIQVTM